MKAILPDGTEIQRSHLGQPYHGTSLTPDVVFSQGLAAKGDDRRLLEHVRGNKVSAFRGTTSAPTVSRHMRQGAAEWAGEDGWVYQFDDIACWDVDKEFFGRVPLPGGLFGDSPHIGECECAVPGTIPARLIMRAGQVESRYGHLRVVRWQDNIQKGKN